MSRVLLGVVVVFVGCGTSVSVDGGTDAGRNDAGDNNEAIDAGPELGTPGAHVWFESSVRVRASQHWVYDEPGPGTGGETCVALNREDLSEDQAAFLETLTLQQMNTACTADGYRYDQLDVLDADGGVTTYRDTGCSYLAVPNAVALLPYGVFQHFIGSGTACP